MSEKNPLYKSFVGVDIGKSFVDLAVVGDCKIYHYANTKLGFKKCFKEHATILREALVVVEATGGYEKALILFLIGHDIDVHQANPRKVKYFIRSFGTHAKTDTLDAHALGQYALERHETLSVFQEKEPALEMLSKLIKRRQELVTIRVQEKNRASGPDRDLLKTSSKIILAALNKTIDQVDQQLVTLTQNASIKDKHQMLKNISGVGDKVAFTLLASMPELGTLTGKQAASLAGVAPHPQQSGQSNGYRKTCGGRQNLKPILFLAAMTAARSKSELGIFYKRLLAAGKKPIVAIVAVMRKIIVIANAKLRDLALLNNHLTT